MQKKPKVLPPAVVVFLVAFVPAPQVPTFLHIKLHILLHQMYANVWYCWWNSFWTPANNGINYQPQLVSLSDFWNINSTFGRIDGFTSGAKYPSTQRQGAEYMQLV